MVRLEAALLIVLAMNLATIPTVSAHALPRTGGLHEGIVTPLSRGPLQQPYIRMSEGVRLATEPTHADAPGGQTQLTGAYHSALTPSTMTILL